MIARWLLAAAHLLALGIGLGAVWARAGALGNGLDTEGVKRALRADTWWGIAALIWIATGLVRLLGGFDKGTAYYLQNHLFWTKMALLALILALEIAPMAGLIRWRIALGRDAAPDLGSAPTYARISRVQAALVLLMVLLASAMARGYGMTGR
jgi:putative membrane protein